MSQKLKDNLTSNYLEAANRLRSKNARKRIVVYVESYDDIAFWRSLLETIETDRYYFQVMLPSATKLSKGKKTVLMNALNNESFGSHLIACVDSDYDYLMQDSTATSRTLNHNPYVFQTYGYAIENYQCYAARLHELCVQATLNDRQIFDFEAFLEAYSCVCYPLFLWNVWLYKEHDTHSFSMTEFNNVVHVKQLNIRHPQREIEDVSFRVEKKLRWLRRHFPDAQEMIDKWSKTLVPLGLQPETTYLFMQGHHIMDNVVMKMLVPVCTQLRREREDEIKNLAEHEEQLYNELTCYQRSISPVETLVRKHSDFEGLFIYDWLCKDLRNYVSHLKTS